MNKVIYLEPDEEITGVVEKVRSAKENGIILVFAKGSTLAHSAINLKLLKRTADKLGKALGLVTTDKVSKNLALQAELPVFDNAKKAESAVIEPVTTAETAEPTEAKSYRSYDLSKMNEDGEPVEKEKEKEPVAAAKADDSEPEERENESEGADLSQNSNEENIERNKDTGSLEDDYLEQDEDEEEPKPDFTHKKIKVEVSGEEDDQHKASKNGGLTKKKKIAIIVSAVLVVVALAGSYVYFPSAEASLILKTDDLNKEFEIIVEKDKADIDLENSTIPGKVVELEKEEQKDFDSTGKKDVGEKAAGVVTVYNNTSKQVAINTSTKFVRDSKEYISLESKFIPAGAKSSVPDGQGGWSDSITPGKVDIRVTAVATGEAYNLAAGNLSVYGRKTTDVYAENKAAFAGGSTKELKFVTAEDLTNAEKDVKKLIEDTGKDAIIAEAEKNGLKIFEDNISLEMLSVDSDKKAGQEGEKFNYKIKAKLVVLGFAENDFRNISLSIVNAGLKDNEMILDTESSSLTYKLSGDEGSKIIMSAEFAGKVGAKINRDILAKNIVFTNDDTALNKLKSVDGVIDASLKIKPSFIKYTPVLKNKIKINFDYEK